MGTTSYPTCFMAVSKIKEELEKEGKSDVMKWWTFMASDVTGSLAFGETFHIAQTGQCNRLVKDIELSMPLVGMRAELPWTKPIMDYTPSFVPGSPNRLWARFTGYGEAAVRATRAALQGGNKTLFSKMVLEDAKEQGIPDELIAQEAANIVAGTDTTAMTLTYLTYAVLLHPEVKKKLVEELRGCSANPKWEELEGLTVLNNVIMETFRLFPAVPGSLVRIVPKGGEMVGKYFIPPGTQVSTQAWTMQRDPSVFEHPLEFLPDRWNNVTPAMHEHMTMFGGAARMCLGQNIARLEILHAVSMLFRECADIKLAKETTKESMEMVDYFAIKPKAGRCMISKERRASS